MIVVAHRIPRDATELARWVDAGADRYEADVQLADDGGVAVSHYLPFLGVRGWLQHDGTRFRWGAGHDPSLADVVGSLPPGSGVLLDPKETRASRRAALVDSLAAALPDRQRFVVSTDHPDDLARYRDAGFETWRTVKDAAALDAVLGGGPLPDAGVSIRHSLLDKETVTRLHRFVPIVVAWTVNDPGRVGDLAALGVDGITTDRPVVAGVVGGPG